MASARDLFCCCLRGVGCNLLGIALNLPDRGRDLIHVFFIAKQRELRNPDGLPCGALRMREFLLQEIMFFRRLCAAEALPVIAIAEAVELVQRWIARLRRDAFGIQCRDEILGRDAGEFFSVYMEDICVLTIARAARVTLLRSDARDLREEFVEHSALTMAVECLFFQAAELYVQNCALPFTQAIIRSVDEMTIEPLAGHAPAIVDGTGLALEVIVIGDDHATFSGGHQFARLETERGADAESANLFSTPLAAMSVGGIFDERDAVLLGDFLQAVEVGRVTSHVDRDDGLGARSNRGLG